jgi:hypothetical protein
MLLDEQAAQPSRGNHLGYLVCSGLAGHVETQIGCGGALFEGGEGVAPRVQVQRVDQRVERDGLGVDKGLGGRRLIGHPRSHCRRPGVDDAGQTRGQLQCDPGRGLVALVDVVIHQPGVAGQ